MTLRNYKYESKAFRVEVSGVSSVNTGKDRSKPNPFYFRRLEESCSANLARGWYVANSAFRETETDFNRYDGVIYNSTELAQVMSSQVRRVESQWPSLTDRCMEKIYDQLRGNSEFLVDLAEAGQTRKMLADALKLRSNMRRFVSDMVVDPKRLKLASARKRIDYVSSKWLEYRYGWLPLMGSIYGAADNLKRGVFERDIHVKARVSSTGSGPDLYRSAGSGQSLHQVSARIKGSFRYQVGASFRPPSRTEQQILHWTSLNPLSIAWELVPLSFVADWFVNVGDQLRSWENHTIYNRHFIGGYQTYSYRERREGTFRRGLTSHAPISYWPNGSAMDGNLGNGHLQVCKSVLQIVDRRVLLSLPRPSGFTFKVNLNAKRVADAAALSKTWWSKLFRK